MKLFNINAEALYELLLAFLYLVPISYFRYSPLKSKFRFSVKITIILYFVCFFLTNLVLLSIGLYNTLPSSNRARAILYVVMTIFSFYLIREHIGKQVYLICFFGNYTMLFSAACLLLEGLIFGNETYNIRFKAISMIIILIPTIPFIYHTSYKSVYEIANRKIPMVWNILWIVGIIQLLLNADLSIPYQVTNIHSSRNATIRLLLSFGSILINQTVLFLIKELMDANDENNALEAEKQQFTIQEYQYRNIQEQIEQSRRFRHDFKHHGKVISSIINDASLSDALKLEKLADYSNEYFGNVPDAVEQHYCDHYSLNLLLNYYYGKSLELGYSFTAKIDVPAQMAIKDTDLSVVVGNLLLNAGEAVSHLPKNTQRISINITKNGKNLLILVENTFDGQLNQKGDIFYSTKHPGEGIGITNVRNITERYHGSCYFDHKEKTFSAMVHLLLEY